MPLPVHTPANLRLQVENATEPVVRNLYPNPLPNSETGWSIAPGTATKSLVTHSGRQWARALFTVAGGPANHGINWGNTPVRPGRVYSASALIRLSMATRVAVYLQFLSSSGAVIGNHATSADVAAGVPTTVKCEGRPAPAGTVNVRILTYGFSGGAAFTANSTMDVANIMLNEGATALAYFDGSTANTAQYVTRWTGTAHASTSERHPNVVRNLFRDPMATRGAWALMPAAPDSRASITTDAATGRYTVGRTSGQDTSGLNRDGISVYLPDVPVAEGTWVRLRFKRHSLTGATGMNAGFTFIDANGGFMAGAVYSAVTFVTGDLGYGPTVQVPAGAVAVLARLGTSGTTLNAAAQFVISEVVLANAPTNTSLSSIALIEPVTWSTNLLGPTHSIDIERVALDLGVMSVVVLDATLDPAISNQLQPGLEVRLQSLVDGGWENLFTGKLRDADVDYVHRGGKGIATRIALEAVDDVSKLANERQRYGYALLANVRAAMMRTTPYRVNGSKDLPDLAAYATVDAQALDEEGTALGWLELARDTNRAYVWVDRDGVTNFAEQPSLSFTPAARFTDVDDGTDLAALYGQITAGFSTRSVINTVTVRWLTLDAGEMTETIYGPFRNAASVRKYGPRAQTITATGFGNESVDQLAAAVLAGQAEATRAVTELTMPVRDTRSMRQATRLDLYDLATARFGTVLDTPVRITSIRHSIRTDRWTTTYGFDPEGAIARPA